MMSDALAKFFGTGEKEMLQSEALGRVWEYIKTNQLEVLCHMHANLSGLLCIFFCIWTSLQERFILFFLFI